MQILEFSLRNLRDRPSRVRSEPDLIPDRVSWVVSDIWLGLGFDANASVVNIFRARRT
jgi:hypothetical protein